MGSPVLPFAQDLEFEQVGDQPLDAQDLEFDQEGTLWADADELYRLVMGTGEWEEINPAAGIGGNLLVLSPDSLLLGSNNAVFRSINGGETFQLSYKEGGALFAADVTGTNHGVILCGAANGGGGTGIGYSTDRGATFTEATFTVSTSWTSTLHTAVEIPDGPAAGRLVAGVFNGIVISEDSGRTWAPSSLFQNGRYWTQRVVIGEDPATGDRRLYSTVTDAQASGPQLYTSDDDGLTWTNVPGMVDAYLFVFVPETTGSLLAVERADAVDGEYIVVWRSIDGGQSWIVVGELPAEVNGGLISSQDLAIGPDGHLYVAVGRAGPDGEWVYRTTEPVFVASEPGVPPAPTAEQLVVYPNPAEDRISVLGVARDEEVVLFDVLGRAVLRSRTPTNIDVSTLLPGVYVVRAGDQSALVTVRR